MSCARGPGRDGTGRQIAGGRLSVQLREPAVQFNDRLVNECLWNPPDTSSGCELDCLPLLEELPGRRSQTPQVWAGDSLPLGTYPTSCGNILCPPQDSYYFLGRSFSLMVTSCTDTNSFFFF